MRPLELRLADFRSYAGGPTTFDFRDRRFLGIVGPIGSGKSSILDAISFALYGKTPAEAANTRSLINQRADGCTVTFRFEVEGEVWETTRALRARGQSQHQLSRLAADEAEPEILERVVQKRDVDERIEALLGLDFDAFGRSVLLAQGRFAQFLAAPPAQKDQVLKGVFGHDRIDAMRDRARTLAQEAGAEATAAAARVEHLDTVVARLTEARAELTAATERQERLEKAAPRAEELDETIATATREAETAGGRFQDLQEAAAQFPKPDETTRLLEAAVEASGRRETLAAALAKAQDAYEEATDRVEQDTSERDVTAKAADLIARLPSQRKSVETAEERRLREAQAEAAATDRLEQARARVRAAEAAHGAAVTAAEAARAERSEAEQRLHQARHAEMAAALRSGLESGEQCPVCRQTVDEVPASVVPPDLAAAEQAAEEAKSAAAGADGSAAAAAAELQAATESVGTAEAAAATAAEGHARAGDDLTSETVALDTLLADITSLIGEGEPEALLRDRRAAHQRLDEAVREARAEATRARQAHDEAIVSKQESDRQLADLRMLLARLAGSLDVDIDLSDAGPDALRTAITDLRTRWKDATDELERRRAAAVETASRAKDARAELLAEAGVEDGDLAGALGAARAARTGLESEIERHEKTVGESEELVAARDRWVARREVMERLAADLTNARFIKFLLDEERMRLADLGSDSFQSLSSGRYRFVGAGIGDEDEDGRDPFDIVDLTAADAVRKASSLSGGETFLASLALALALAEMVARSGGRLDAFFLDEGFGTLDPESRDLAMEGIEALVEEHPDRIVVVVSHVPELRERIEDLIVLDRDPTTGDTRVVRGARVAAGG